MSVPSLLHPDRLQPTLVQIAAANAPPASAWQPPGAGSRDSRIDLKLLLHRAQAAMQRSAAARDHLAPVAAAQHPDLWAGTVQDGVARGFAVRLEEAIALAGSPAEPALDPDGLVTLQGKELRRKKDLLVASKTSRVRFSRKEGLLYVDRDDGQHSSNCLRFEARTDHGCLDDLVPDLAERPRLFSAQFLQPQAYSTGAGMHRLRLVGRLGRGPRGWNCELVVQAEQSAPGVHIVLRIENRQRDCRLRARFLGIPSARIQHACTDVREVVANETGGFVAFTLVRACGRLQTSNGPVPVPGAQCEGWLEHRFVLGGE
jgi:hypothetical protein